uniref:Uncharacterized protein n=1 Tax=Leersia perrieri TaxID=77586 RepID=A0A0D9W2F1_9ORYZ
MDSLIRDCQISKTCFTIVPALCLALAGPNLIQNQQNNQQILLMWLPVTRPGRTLTMGSYQKLP